MGSLNPPQLLKNTEMKTTSTQSEILAIELSNENYILDSGILENNGVTLEWATSAAWDVSEGWETVNLVINGQFVAQNAGIDGHEIVLREADEIKKLTALVAKYLDDETAVISEIFEEIPAFNHKGWDNFEEDARNAKIEALRDNTDLVVIENNYESETSQGFANTATARYANDADDKSSHGWHTATPLNELLETWPDEILALTADEES